ncbi:tubulin folding cofactor C [Tritrichomonas foetus]|uniref:Tubulin folding cofactor C n=1 Tax=Tritrichomonas foetus TaxID=1144522 RepID=A0A1J4JEE4_9EUKA|nr:tubulin folding cofactor C [Tritrichomonas foetus]|eukprot:OHS95628.1 tubulin folding cofactor C [Tritrichomonas foetus]
MFFISNTDQLNLLLFKGDAAAFQKEFESRLNALKKQVELQKGPVNNETKEKQKNELDVLSDALRKGGKQIPPFYQAKFQRALDELQKKFSNAPKPAFSFSFSKQMKPASETVTKPVQKDDENDQNIPETDWTLHDLKDQKIKHQCDGKHISINQFENCTLLIENEVPSISFNNAKNCIFIVPIVTGSAHITKCESCTFVFSIKQLRIHQTSKTDFYISIASDPIIEKCTEMRFAPLKGDESGPWDKVKDFDHPETYTSPNWSIIPESERKIPEF